MMINRLLKLILLIAAFLLFASCSTTLFGPSEKSKYIRNGKEYGITKGSFRGRWWNYYERGVSFSDGRFWAEAEKDLKGALKGRDRDQRRARTYGLHFVSYFPHRELGLVYYNQNRYGEAVKELEKSLSSEKTAKAELYLDRARAKIIEKNNSDKKPPEIIIQAPDGPVLTNLLSIEVKGIVKDDTYVKKVMVNGRSVRIDLAAREVPFSVKVPLTRGDNQIRVFAEDLADRTSLMRIPVKVDREGPVLSLDDPVFETGGVSGPVRLSGYAFDNTGLKEITINGQKLAVPDGQEMEFEKTINILPGTSEILVEAVDLVGNTTKARIFLEEETAELLVASNTLNKQLFSLFWRKKKKDPALPPFIELKDLVEDQTVFSDKVYIEGEVSAGQVIQQLTINGRHILPRPGKNIFFNYLAKLNEGKNTFLIEAVSIDGGRVKKSFIVRREIRKVRALQSRLVVAIFPFYNPMTNKPDRWGSNVVLGDILEEKNRFMIVERAEIDKLLFEQKLSALKLTDKKTAIEAGRIANVDTLFLGTVREKEETMDIFIRVVDTETSEIIATADVYGEDMDLKASQLLTEGLALKLMDELPFIEGTVLDVGSDEFDIDLNHSHKIKQGMKLIVFREDDQTSVKDSDELGRAVITMVEEHKSSAKMSAKPAPKKIEPGYKVITR